MKTLLFLCAGWIVLTHPAFSCVITVPDDYSTIQGAIVAASPGDTILVREGTYQEAVNFDGKNIVVASFFLTTGNPDLIDQTVITAPPQSPAVKFTGGEPETARLVGFTIKNGTGVKEGFSWYGGGIYCSNSHPSLENLKIKENVAGGLGGCGGGIYFRESHSRIIHCTIEDNEAGYGGGIRCDGSSISVSGTLFKDNFAVASGGGIMFVQCSSPRIEQCTFTGNNGIYGGAIASNGSTPVIDRVTCFHNHGGYGGALNAEGNSGPKVINSIFWDNSIDPSITNEIFLGAGYNSLLVAYSDILGGDTAIHITGNGTVNWMEGNIEMYPCFADTTLPDLTLTGSSPCIDAGISVYVFSGDTIVHIEEFSGTAPDMGSHEYAPPVNVPSEPGDGRLTDIRIVKSGVPGTIRVEFTNPQEQPVAVSLFDIRGSLICDMEWNTMPAGTVEVPLRTGDFPAGIYIVRVVAGRQSGSLKFMP